MSWILMGRSSNYTNYTWFCFSSHDLSRFIMIKTGPDPDGPSDSARAMGPSRPWSPPTMPFRSWESWRSSWMVCQGIISRFFLSDVVMSEYVRILTEDPSNPIWFSYFSWSKANKCGRISSKAETCPWAWARMSRGSGMEKLFLPENAQKLKETCAVYGFQIAAWAAIDCSIKISKMMIGFMPCTCRCRYIIWLVVWNMNFMILGIIIPTDELIFFQRGRSTTNQDMYSTGIVYSSKLDACCDRVGFNVELLMRILATCLHLYPLF